jgi:hypothetical protein
LGLSLPVRPTVAPFDRHFFTGKEKFTSIGQGDLGGKAHGLAMMRDVLRSRLGERHLPEIEVNIPTLTVIATEMFDLFMKQNDLYDDALSNVRDDLIAVAFQKASLPPLLVGDLRVLIDQVHTPLAVRSSSRLEDAIFEPFASVYATKMIPNNQTSPDSRFHKLDEKMAVIIQEVVGVRHGQRFYPHISGVARSFNFYPLGHSKPADGVIDLALGLGKTIVDDGIAWSYSPAYPRANPPTNTLDDLLNQTQSEFWAVNMGPPAEFNPIKETEYIVKFGLGEAEKDGVLRFLASTYRAQDEKIVYGIAEKGPRVIDFAPILKFDLLPLNRLLQELLKLCEDTLGQMVEVEFAMTLDEDRGVPARFGFLQVRPMVVSSDRVAISPEDLEADNVLLASESALGNGVLENIRDIVYVKPDTFNVSYSEAVGAEIDGLNRGLMTDDRPYLLIGSGRWGTSDPQAGIPVNFGQICGAKVIVECALPETSSMLSQGSHFFHNITSFRVFYFSLGAEDRHHIDWDWIHRQPVVHETGHVRHVRPSAPLKIKVDGTTGRGVIQHG